MDATAAPGHPRCLPGLPTERAAKEWLGRGRGPHVVIAGRHASFRDELLAWLRACQVSPRRFRDPPLTFGRSQRALCVAATLLTGSGIWASFAFNDAGALAPWQLAGVVLVLVSSCVRVVPRGRGRA